MTEYNHLGVLKALCLVIFFGLFSKPLFSQKRLSVHVSTHYGYHFFTSDDEKEEGEKGQIGNGIEVRYHFGSQTKKVNFAFGLAYNRLGFKRSFQWTDATPEREELYGKFPISYEMWDDHHYISFPLHLNIHLGDGWKVSVSGSLDYPLGAGYFRER